MQFAKRNITKQLRNGEPYAALYSGGASSTGGASSAGGGIGGNYLPATIDDEGNYVVDLSLVHFTGNLYTDGEISALGQGTSSGSTATTGNVEIIDNLTSTSITAALSANQGRILNGLVTNTYTKAQVDTLLANLDVDVDLTNYYTKSTIDTKLAGKSDTSHTHSNYSLTSHTHDDRYYTESEINTKLAAKSDTGHTHTIANITSLETSLNAKYDKSGGTISGDVYVTGNIVCDGEISALGAGSGSGSGGGGTTEVIDNLTSTSSTAALSANQGRILNNAINNTYTKTQVDTLLSNLDVDVDLTDYFTKSEINTKLAGKSDTSHTHSNYSTTSHTHAISAITNLQSTLNGKSDTSHTHSNYSVTSHTHNYSALRNTAHTHSISNITNLQSSLDGKSNTGHTHEIADINSLSSTFYYKSGGTISGNVSCTGNITAMGEITALDNLNILSDARFKKNITTLQNRGKLNPVIYIKNGKESIGFIAQDVKELYPELVTPIYDMYDECILTLNYPQLTAVLSAQINELYDVIDKLKNEIKDLKKQ